jgi:aryl-alcohol dehydrogenase-like predicted oxidoreductase
MRFVLGTVQLGLPYGRLRHHALMPAAAAEAILDHAWRLGVRAFDTAEAYGQSASRLADWIARGGHAASVITKIGPEAALDGRAVQAAVSRFSGIANDVTLLTHGAVGGDAWAGFRDAAEAAGARCGQSVYEPGEVRAAVAQGGVALVQAPGNVFDDRALAARSEFAVPLDLRSVFLQGALLEDPEAADARAPGTGPLVRAVRRAASEAGTRLDAMLVASMLARCGARDRIVLGVDSPEELEVIPAGLAVQPATVAAFVAALAQQAVPFPGRVADPRNWV